MKADCFVAIDFETADYGRDSACALALVRVEKKRLTKRIYHLLRPPRKKFIFTPVHNLTWKQVAKEPTFQEVWPRLLPLFTGADFIAAHNAAFDRGVLWACCQKAGVSPPDIPFLCTMKLARRVWQIYPTTLPSVCDRLGIRLNHHHAASDAQACARIVLKAKGRR